MKELPKPETTANKHRVKPEGNHNKKFHGHWKITNE